MPMVGSKVGLTHSTPPIVSNSNSSSSSIRAFRFFSDLHATPEVCS